MTFFENDIPFTLLLLFSLLSFSHASIVSVKPLQPSPVNICQRTTDPDPLTASPTDGTRISPNAYWQRAKMCPDTHPIVRGFQFWQEPGRGISEVQFTCFIKERLQLYYRVWDGMCRIWFRVGWATNGHLDGNRMAKMLMNAVKL